MREFELIEASQKQRGASLRAAFGPGHANSTDFTLSVQTETPAHAADPLLAFRTASSTAGVWQKCPRLPLSAHKNTPSSSEFGDIYLEYVYIFLNK